MAGKYTDEERIARGQYRDENGDWRTSSGYRIRTSGGTVRDEDAQEAAPAAGAGSAVQTLKKQKKELEESAREAARQVYLDRMLTEKVLPQQLTASGRTGGLEDRTRNRLEESYEKQQKEIIKQRDEAKDEIDEQIRAIRRAQSEAAEYENFETGGGREEMEPESRVLGSYSVSPQSPAAAQAVSQPAAKKLTYQEAAAQMRKEGVSDAAIAGMMTQSEWKRRKNAGSASAGDYADYDDYVREYMRKAANHISETAVLPTAQETEFIPDQNGVYHGPNERAVLEKYGGRITTSNQSAEMRMAQQEDAKLLARQQAGKPEAGLLESLDTLLRAVNPLEKMDRTAENFLRTVRAGAKQRLQEAEQAEEILYQAQEALKNRDMDTYLRLSEEANAAMAMDRAFADWLLLKLIPEYDPGEENPLRNQAESARRKWAQEEHGFLGDAAYAAADMGSTMLTSGVTGLPFLALTALQSGADKAAQVLDETGDAQKALEMGIGSGAVSAGVESMFGIAGKWGSPLLKKMAGSAAGQKLLGLLPNRTLAWLEKLSRKKLAQVLGNAAGEGIESLAEDELQRVFENLMLDRDTPRDIREELYRALVSFTVGGVFDVGRTAFDTIGGKTADDGMKSSQGSGIISGNENTSAALAQYGDELGRMGTYVENPGIQVDWTQYAEHATDKMKKRDMTQELVNSIVRNGKVLSQNNENKFVYITQEGVVVMSKEGRLITAWPKKDFDSNMTEIIEKLFGEN